MTIDQLLKFICRGAGTMSGEVESRWKPTGNSLSHLWGVYIVGTQQKIGTITTNPVPIYGNAVFVDKFDVWINQNANTEISRISGARKQS